MIALATFVVGVAVGYALRVVIVRRRFQRRWPAMRGEQLDQWGAIYDVRRRKGEGDRRYRARLVAAIGGRP